MNLKCITCISLKNTDQSFSLDLMEAIWRTSSIRVFQLIFKSKIIWDFSWISKLKTSNLETFRLSCREIIFLGNPHPTTCRTKVTRFALQATDEYDFYKVISMLKALPNLEELYLSHLDQRLLEAICQNQVRKNMKNNPKKKNYFW